MNDSDRFEAMRGQEALSARRPTGRTFLAHMSQPAGGIKIGESVEGVLRRGGKGVLKGSAIAIGGDTNTVTFHLPNAKVTQITYECYTG